MKRKFTFTHNGETIEVQASRQGNTVILEREGRSWEVVLVSGDGIPQGPAASAAPSGAPRAAAPGEPSPAVSGGSGPGAGAGDVPAPMTGVIKEILVSEGDTVNEGEKLMIMEAMKMDIEVTAFTSGTVMKIFVKQNDSVKEGQALVKTG